MKKMINLIFVAVFFILLLSNNNKVIATDEIASGNCGNSVTWSLSSNGILTISGTGNMSGSSCAWADYKDEVREVVFNGNITSISACAFEYNSNIETITLPSSITSIGRRAFAECSNLRTVESTKNLVVISESAFYKCTSLESIELLSDSYLYIREAAFAECTSLKTITMKLMVAFIGDSEWTIGENTTICGYKCSSAYYYAINYGRAFKDLNTNETIQKTITNQDYLDVLPTSNLEALGPTSHGRRSYSSTGLHGYITEFAYEKDITNTNYLNIKAKVEELTANCQTEREKAYAITNWVFKNIKYVSAYGADASTDRIYQIFKDKEGNCESYTMLTNYMFTLCNIPTATVSNMTHEWSAAFVDGKWIYIDSTHGRFDITEYNTVNVISFAYDGLVYVVDDPEAGCKVTGIAKTDLEINELTSFTIPTNSYMKSIYRDAFPSKIELRAEVGTVGAEYIKNNRPYCTTSNNQIIGKLTKDIVGDVDGDGKVNFSDYAAVLAHVKKIRLLTGEELQRADVNGDSRVNFSDYAAILAHVKKIKLLG